MKTQDGQMDAALHRHQDAMRRLIRSNVDSARVRWGALPKIMLRALKGLSIEHRLSVRSGDLLPLDGRWYVTHTGLLRLARTHPSRVCQIYILALVLLPAFHLRLIFCRT